jgi:hypothetical protein
MLRLQLTAEFFNFFLFLDYVDFIDYFDFLDAYLMDLTHRYINTLN